MKWYENVNMLKEILENISKELEEVEYRSRVWHLLTDENNLIKNHLELIKENKELKANIDSEVNFLTNELYEEQKINIDLVNKYTKLKKVIEDIKNLPNCDICDANWHKGCMCLKKKIDEVLDKEVED